VLLADPVGGTLRVRVLVEDEEGAPPEVRVLSVAGSDDRPRPDDRPTTRWVGG